MSVASYVTPSSNIEGIRRGGNSAKFFMKFGQGFDDLDFEDDADGTLLDDADSVGDETFVDNTGAAGTDLSGLGLRSCEGFHKVVIKVETSAGVTVTFRIRFFDANVNQMSFYTEDLLSPITNPAITRGIKKAAHTQNEPIIVINPGAKQYALHVSGAPSSGTVSAWGSEI
jgi:hypothetical protein